MLVVVAHPDDCEAACGGTVAKWTSAGSTAHLLVLTDGAVGSHDTRVSANELRGRRKSEQRAAALVLGVSDVSFLDRPDGALKRGDSEVRETATLIRSRMPEIVLGHDPWLTYELHPDHRAAGWIVSDALIQAREPRIRLDSRPHWRPRELWLFWPERPNHREDITATLNTKADALLRHVSQYESAFGIHASDPDPEGRLRDTVANWAAGAGDHCIACAEAFTRLST